MEKETKPLDFDELVLLMGGHTASQLLWAGVQLEVFSTLKGAPGMTAADLGTTLRLEPRPLRILLTGLTALRLLTKAGDRYQNSDIVNSMLVKDAPGNWVDVLGWQHYIVYPGQMDLVESLRQDTNVGLQRFAGEEDNLYARLAHDPSSLNGKLLALTPREYHGGATVRPAIVATGLRNTQGFDWQPGSGRLIATEHGPTGFDGPEGYDEVNALVPGGDYGWPDVFGADTGGGRFTAPLRVYRDAIAPSGATFVTRSGSRWTGDFLLAALRGEQLRRLVLRAGRVVRDQPLLSGRFGRLRTIVEGPRGALYALTSNRDGRGLPRRGDDRILRVEPPAPRGG